MQVNPNNKDIFSEEYLHGDETASHEVENQSVDDQEGVDFNDYTLNKPKRITIRASIIDDTSQNRN